MAASAWKSDGNEEYGAIFKKDMKFHETTVLEVFKEVRCYSRDRFVAANVLHE